MSRYFFATIASRLLLVDLFSKICKVVGNEKEDTSSLIPIPAASMCLLEKLGVATAFTVVDDHLACEIDSIPQQLLIPSANGLKLLDICPTYGEDETEDESSERKRTGSGFESPESSDSEDSTFNKSATIAPITPIRRLKRLRKRVPSGESPHLIHVLGVLEEEEEEEDDKNEVQFEDPLWWQHLPSLKCIGLTCMLIERENELMPVSNHKIPSMEEKLVSHIAVERRRRQFQFLGSCIGFEAEDVTSYAEITRLQLIS
eukprot:CAMPEP_0178935754 /NCGR_PEP_ID=MMETSP0786-20121207/24734_1 /TAXON_ID=186022 /ORGANISM="Thalassionema frauenfeldii, Strain CCMP 1798" /LENGTH=258 /DNA_ID=CAMNT_0020613963 /DNA_START=706 /DNA_END=1479 /DNA_ORIENTATION=+